MEEGFVLDRLKTFCNLIIFFISSVVIIGCKTNFVSDVQIPQHLVDIWWGCNFKSKEFQSITFDFEIENVLTSDKYIFIAPLGYINISDRVFYAGLQTDIFGISRDKITKRVNHGSGSIFSMWPKKNDPISLNDIDYNHLNGFYEIGDYEGKFISIRTPFVLKNGKYKLMVNQIINDNVSWVECKLLMPDKSIKSFGRIRVSKNFLLLNKDIASFVEIYRKDYSANKNLSIKFQRPMIDGIACEKNKTKIIKPKYFGFNYSDGLIIDNSDIVSISGF